MSKYKTNKFIGRAIILFAFFLIACFAETENTSANVIEKRKLTKKRTPEKLTPDRIWKRHYEIYVKSNPDLPDPGFGTHDFNSMAQSSVSGIPKIIGGLDSLQNTLQYPELLKNNGVGADILVMTYVDTNGLATSARVMSSSAKCKFYAFEQAACQAVQHVKFVPAMIKSKPVSRQVWITVKFTPEITAETSDQECVENNDLFFRLPVDPPYPLPKGAWENLNKLAVETAGKGIKGYTVIRTYIDTSGSVLKTKPIWPPTKISERDEAAMSVIKNTKFKPAMLRGKIPVGAWFNIPVIFKLSE